LLNYQLSPKLKLLRYGKFNHLTTQFLHTPLQQNTHTHAERKCQVPGGPTCNDI